MAAREHRDRKELILPLCSLCNAIAQFARWRRRIGVGAQPPQGLNRGIRQIRAREMDRLSLPAFAYSAHSAVALAAPVAAWPAEPQRELPQGPATSGRKIEGEKMKARPDRHPSCLGG